MTEWNYDGLSQFVVFCAMNWLVTAEKPEMMTSHECGGFVYISGIDTGRLNSLETGWLVLLRRKNYVMPR